MMRRLLPLALLLGLIPFAMPASAAPHATFYETLFIADPDGDYDAQGQGALDILNVYVAEKYSTTFDRDVLQFRVELRAPSDIQFNTQPTGNGGELTGTITYMLGFKTGGAAKQYTAEMHVVCHAQAPTPTSPAYECSDPYTSEPNYVNQTSFFFVIDVAAEGLLPGDALTDGYAASRVLLNEEPLYHDLAPLDNMDQPCGLDCVLAGTGAYTLEGNYPFLTVISANPTVEYFIQGGSAFYAINYDAVLAGGSDALLLNFTAPQGWMVEPNLVSGSGVQGSGPFSVNFKVTAAGTAERDTTEAIIVDAQLLKSGGRVLTTLYATVVPPLFEHPDYKFSLMAGNTPKKGEMTNLLVSITKSDLPAVREQVWTTFYHNGVKMGELDTEYIDNGTYSTDYSFNEAGVWQVDVRIVKGGGAPSPHSVFTLNVAKDGGKLPGFEAGIVLVALGLLFALRRPD